MEKFLKLIIAIVIGIVAVGIQSCGNNKTNKSDSSEDSVVVTIGTSVDENGNIVVSDDDEYVGVMEVMESNPIDESLERLANAMADYIKARATDNEVLRKAYGDDIANEVRFLDKHTDEMTDSQKELYAKLNAIEI